MKAGFVWRCVGEEGLRCTSDCFESSRLSKGGILRRLWLAHMVHVQVCGGGGRGAPLANVNPMSTN